VHFGVGIPVPSITGCCTMGRARCSARPIAKRDVHWSRRVVRKFGADSCAKENSKLQKQELGISGQR